MRDNVGVQNELNIELPQADLKKLVGITENWEVNLKSLLTGTWNEDAATYIIVIFKRLFTENAKELNDRHRKVPTACQFYPILRTVTECTRRLCEEYSSTTIPLVLIVMMCAYQTLCKVVSQEEFPIESEQHILESLTKDTLLIHESIVLCCLRMAESSKKRDFSSIEILCGTPLNNQIIKLMRKSANKLPYGKLPSAAFAMLSEFVSAISKEALNWSDVIRQALEKYFDSRRAAELLMWQASSFSTAPMNDFSLVRVDDTEAEYILHHSAEGIPHEESFGILGTDTRVEQAKQESARSGAGDFIGDDELIAGNPMGRRGMRRGDRILQGRWYTCGCELNFSHSTRREEGYRVDIFGLLPTRITAVCVKLEDDTDFPFCPTPKITPHFGIQLEKYTIWIPLPQHQHHQSNETRIPIILRDESNPNRFEKIILQKDEYRGEPVVSFASRVLQTTLKAPPAPDLYDKCKKAFSELPGFASSLLQFLGDRGDKFNVRHCYPETLIVVLRAIEDSDTKLKGTISGPKGWLHSQAMRHPCVNLISIYGLAFEEKDLQPTPTGVMASLKLITQTEVRQSGDPLAVVNALSLVSRHDFDGGWTWLNGFNNLCYPDAFTVTGHHIALNHPALSSGIISNVKYGDVELRFTLTIKRSMKREHMSLLNVPESRDVTFQVVLIAQGTSRSPDYISGSWGGDRHICWFQRSTVNPVTCSWGKRAISACVPQLRDIISGWDARWLENYRGMASLPLLKRVFAHRKRSDHTKEYGDFMIKLWGLCCERIVITQKIHGLDDWILCTAREMSELTGIRADAADTLLSVYFDSRSVKWDSIPIDLKQVCLLESKFTPAKNFAMRIETATKEFQNRLNSHRISRHVYSLSKQHSGIHERNGITFPELDFNAPIEKLEHSGNVLRELVEQWEVKGAGELLNEFTESIVRKELVNLDDLEKLVKKAGVTLGEALTLPHATSSPLLRAHFLILCDNKGVSLAEFQNSFGDACKSLSSIKLDSTIEQAVAGLHPPDGNYEQGRKRQEKALMEEIKADKDAINALLDGGLPLRFVVHDLEILRRMVNSPQKDLRFHSQFFNETEKRILLDDDLSKVTLKDAKIRSTEIKRVSCGCEHRVLEIMRTVYNCTELVEFTRENPEAQDEGLASVLSNSTDLQHASFQTFFNLTNFVNPFVWASSAYVEQFNERRSQLIQDKRDAGEQGDIPYSGVEMRIPISNSGFVAGSDITGDGFWSLMNNSFGDDTLQDVRNIQKKLEKMTAVDEIEKLVKMIKEQSGTTDRMIIVCHYASGLQGIPEGIQVDEDDYIDRSAALIIINLPTTGQPALEFDAHDGKLRNMAEYSDLVYRATLQRNEHSSLEVFANQAREVMRAFNTACALFSEGHIEFRSRRITFRHDDAARLTQMLQSLEGQWAKDSESTTSLFVKMCQKYPEIICVTPAELVRTAELMRSTASITHSIQDMGRLLSWRKGKMKMIQRVERAAAVHEYETVDMSVSVLSTAIQTRKFASIPFVKLPEDNEPLLFEGLGVCDGEFEKGLWMYKREDGLVLSPVAGGWVVYDKPVMNARRLLVSMSDNESYLQPWQMGDWRESDSHGFLNEQPCLNAKVQADDAFTIVEKWSDDCRGAEHNIHVQSPKVLEALGLKEMASTLYVISCAKYSVWESLGFEAGMRIVAVNNKRTKKISDLAKEFNTESAKAKPNFTATVIPAYIWLVTTKDAIISANGREVTKMRGTAPAIAVSPAPALIWRIKITGDVFASRIGLCTKDLDLGKPVDESPNKESAYWYMRNGTLRHNGLDVDNARAFRSGDIITVIYDQKAKTIDFKLNGRRNLARFTDVSRSLKPCVYLVNKTAKAVISPGEPVDEVLGWNTEHIGKGLKIDGPTVISETETETIALGNRVMVGPGPHTFSILVKGRNLSEHVGIGVAAPGVPLNKSTEPDTSMFAMQARRDGSVFVLKHTRNLGSTNADTKPLEVRLSFTVDLGEGTIDIHSDGERLFNSVTTKNFPKVEGPLVPYVVFRGKDVKCTFFSHHSQESSCLDDVSVVIKGTTPPDKEKDGICDGLYRRWIPTYNRKDGKYRMTYWDGRWCVTDAAERPVAWSNPCKGTARIGSEPLRWTVVDGFQEKPYCIRVVSKSRPGGILTLQKQTDKKGFVIYENDELRLSRDSNVQRWVVSFKNGKNTEGLYMSSMDQPFPHYCTKWTWGDGKSWREGARVNVLACSSLEELKQDASGLYWNRHEFGTGWESANKSNIPELQSVDFRPAVQLQATVSKSSMDSMTEDELAVWHTIEKSTGAVCRAAELRIALREAAEGSTNGLEMFTDWESTAVAKAVIAEGALSTLDRIGKLLQILRKKNKNAKDPRISCNYDPAAARYGQLQTRTVEGAIVDTSRLAVSDRKLFAIALHEGDVRPYHVLDCTAQTPAENVRAFLQLYKQTKKGRLVVMNLNLLSPDQQNEVRLATEGKHEHKELIAVVTGGDGSDETVEYVDNLSCDVKWKKWAMGRCCELNNFKSITYYLQRCGTGKSYSIDKKIKSGEFGSVLPTRLDLDSTKNSLDEICTRLMGPMRERHGLLVIHVGQDSDPQIVNQVLDSLIFFGRIESNSGLAVSIPKKTWHLVVEFQHPPDAKESLGREKDVNGPWKRSNGMTDITLLACSGLATAGTLDDFDIKEVPGAQEAMSFIKDTLTDVPSDNKHDLNTLKLMCLGHDTVEIESIPAVERQELELQMETITNRMLVRSLKHLVYQYKMYITKLKSLDSARRTKKQALVVRTLMHEMHTMLFPHSKDNYHIVVMGGGIKQRMEFSMDKLAEPFEGEAVTALQKLRQAIIDETDERLDFMLQMKADKSDEKGQKQQLRAAAQKRREQQSTAPLHTLIESLADELCIEKRSAVTALRGQNYVLIPDFLQKLVQMYCHLRIQDPPILQGPSGTGKSYAVTMLSDLLQLPPNASAAVKREGHNDLISTFAKWVKQTKELKKLFPDGEPDVSLGYGKTGIIVDANFANGSVRSIQCMRILVDKGDFDALDYLRECVNDVLGPLINDRISNPNIAEILDDPRKQKFRDSVKILNSGVPKDIGNDKERSEKLYTALEEVVNSLNRVSGGFLVGQIRDTMGSALSSQTMRKLAGASFSQFESILNKRHLFDGIQTWAKEAFTAAKANGPALCRAVRAELRNQIRLSPILDPPPSLLRDLSDGGENSGEALADLLRRTLTLKRSKSSLIILMRYDMTVDMLFDQMSPMLEKALKCPTINFMIMIDEMNATNMLGLIKRIVVDRYWDKWELSHPETNGILPPNVSFLGAVNPTTKDASLEGLDVEEYPEEETKKQTKESGEKLGFDVTPMQPALKEHIVPWKQLAANQREMFIMRLMGSNRNLFAASIRQSQLRALSDLLLHTHKFAQRAVAHKRSTVSQRDIHRTMKLFDFFYKQGVDYISFNGKQAADVWDRTLSAMTVAMACSYYFRFPPEQRASLSKALTERLSQLAGEDEEKQVRAFPQGVAFDTVVQRAVTYHCHSDHLKLPDAVYAHQGLMENLFVQMVCFELRLAVILQGAPGTSKTLSNNIIRDNMQGCGLFWKDFCHISDICRYQGSAQSSADEIKKKCEEAYQKQLENDSSGTLNKRTLLFVDEAGLVKGATVERKWALKVLHYYLEGANLASVLMTNTSLDTAIGNRCVTVFMAKPRPEELTNMCAGILSKHGVRGLCEVSKRIIPACCDAFHRLVPPPKEDEEETLVGFDPSLKFRWWFGLRDLFHMMRYIRRNNSGEGLITVSPELVLRALERNFNGPSEYFDAALRRFGEALGEVDGAYSVDELKPMLRRKLDVVIDSLKDNNRATEKASGKNLNDMWVRFKLLVDTTEDGSMLQLLRQTGVEQFNNLSVLSLSSLSYGDELMPVTVVSQIVAAMEAGRTVWLTNTRDIDACLFDVFNQNYVVASSGANETLHFVAVAVGAALEYKRVHRDFQCIVHVTKRELTGMGNVLPSPFLNRLEKFPITVQDILEFALAKLKPEEREAAMEVRQKLAKFQKTLAVRNRCLFGDSDVDTFDSVILEGVQQGTLMNLPVNLRIRNDDALDGFLAGSNADDARWKASSCRMLQVLKPEGMLLAQRVLKKDAPAYLRAYFRDLAPWDLTGYLEDLRDKVAPSATGGVGDDADWLRSVVFSPSNADFPSLLEPIEHLTHLSLDGLLESERGREDLKEELYRFTTDPEQYVFVLIMSPDSLGKPECREVRYLLSSRPDVREKEKDMVTDKAVVIIQSFQNSNLTEASNCTPLFGSGWDQVYLDAAAEHVKLDLQQYVDPMIVGKRAPRPIPEWRDLEVLLDRAMNTLMQAQSEAATKWVPVPEEDPASALYDLKRPFDEQVAIAKKLFKVCPKVKKVVVNFYRARQPTELELVEMAKEVAAQDGQSLSLAQRLIDEENKAPRALLTFALRFLLDDRNASALLCLASQKGKEKELAKSDTIVAKALEVASRATTFDILRRKKVSTLDTIYVGVSMPSLPGSSSIIETLPVASNAVDVVATASELERRFGDEMVRELVDAVQSDRELVLAFLSDHIRRRIRYSDLRIVENVLNWVFELVRGLHQLYFPGKEETVWSIRALCSVASAAVDDYIMAMVPLAAMGALDKRKPPSIISQESGHNAAWVAHELGPQLLLEAFPEMAENRLGEFKTACSSMLHRVTSEWIVQSKHAPCLSIIGAVISGIDKLNKKSIDLFQSFIKSSCNTASEGTVPVDLKIIESLLKEHPSSTCRVALQLASLSRDFTSDSKVPQFVIGLVVAKGSSNVTRSMAARIIRQLNETRGSSIPAPVELAKNGVMQKWIQSAAEGETGKKMGSKCESYNPNGKNAEKSMNSKLYLAVYDVCYDNDLGMDAEHVLVDTCLRNCESYNVMLSEFEDSPTSKKALLSVMMKAKEAAFIIALAVVFIRPVEQQDKRDWAPSFMENNETVEKISKLAKRIFEPAGYKCPERLSQEDLKLINNPPDLEIENSLLTFMNTLESGIGSLRGMGTKSMLLYMQDQVVDSDSGRVGAMPTICGEAMRHKCQNSEPLKAKAGDLPFVVDIEDPLHTPFLQLQREMMLSGDMQSTSLEQVNKVVKMIVDWAPIRGVESTRLLFYYAAFKCFFGENSSHPMADKFLENEELAKVLKLDAKLLRVLGIAFDARRVKDYPTCEVDISLTLLAGFKSDWTEVIITSLCVACAYPKSFMGSMFFDVDAQKHRYLPGDKTGGDVTHGGCYKFDCVTQLDENGAIASYSRGQEVLSTGACYLLWAVEFGALAIQLTLWPESFKTLWEWMFSPTIRERIHGYQQGISDYRHLVHQMTERSIAYHLHMGVFTGLSVDETQKIFSYFSHQLMTSDVLKMESFKSRAEAMEAEREVEALWQRYNDKKLLAKPQQDACHALNVLTHWKSQHFLDLPREGSIRTAIERLSAEETPELLTMALHENVKLALLAPLLTDLYSFSNRVQRMLSNRLLLKYTDGEDELMTPFRSVLELFEEHTHESQYLIAVDELKRIQENWNKFMTNVGPIDFECQQGGINVIIDDIRRGGNIPGLPGTLDFWLTFTDSPYPQHKNMIKAALTSLTDKYNKCQAIVAKHTKIQIEDVDLSSFSPSRPDLLLQELGHSALGEVCRSHAKYDTETRSFKVDWNGIEKELSFASGLILPKIEMPYLAPFRFLDPEEPVVSNEVEQSAIDLLAVQPDRHCNRLSTPQLKTLTEATKGFSEDQITMLLSVLVAAFKDRDTEPTESLYDAVRKGWIKKTIPLTANSLCGVQLSHVREVMVLLLEKMEKSDWLTSHIELVYHERLPETLIETIEERYRSYLQSHATDTVLDVMEAVSDAACSFLKSLGEPRQKQSLMDIISDVLMGEHIICGVFEGVLCEHIVHFIRYVKTKLRKLRESVTQDNWYENQGRLREVPHVVVRGDSEPFYIEVNDNLIITSCRNRHQSNLERGMHIVAIDKTRVTTKAQVLAALETSNEVIEISVDLTDEDDIMRPDGIIYEMN